MTPKKWFYVGMGALFAGLFSFASCGEKAQATYKWELGDLGEVVDCHTAEQKEFLLGDYTAIKADGSEEKSRPNLVSFT